MAISPKTKWLIIITSIAALYLDSWLNGAAVPIVAEWEWSSTDVILNSTESSKDGDEETRSSFVIDAIFLSTGLVEIVLSPFVGMVADKCGFDAVVITGLLLGVFKCLLLGCFGTSVWIVSIDRVLQGVVSACTQTIAIARIRDMYAETSPECSNVMAVAMCKSAVGFFAGLFTGQLYIYLKYRVFLLVLPIPLLLIICVLITFRTENFHSQNESKREDDCEKISSSAVRWRVICDVQLLIILTCFFVASLATVSLDPAIAVWMQFTFRAGPDMIGIVLGLCGVATIMGNIASARILPVLQDRIWVLCTATLCLTGLPLLLINFSPSIYAAGAFLCSYNIFLTATRFALVSMCATLATKRYPRANGLVFAMLNVGWAASFLIGPLLSSFLFGSTCVICMLGAACIAVSSLNIFLRQLETKRGPNLMDCFPKDESGYMALADDEKVPFTYDILKESLQPQEQ